MEIEYSAWLSSAWERRQMRNGALFCGLVRDLPQMFKHLIDPDEKRMYCTIRVKKERDDDRLL